MSSTKLKNAPLKEVIFELHWECDVDASGLQRDIGFNLAQGKFADKLKNDFPLHRQLIPDGMPVEVFGAPFHQYWTGEFLWPVIQHGQGMISVNEVEQGYEWEKSFKPLIHTTIQRIIGSYEEILRFNKVKLQYIDAYDLDDQIAIDFISQNLQTSINTNYELPGKLKGFNLQQKFELSDFSTLDLNISSAINTKNRKESVLWTTTVEKKTELSADQIKEWLEFAHSWASKIFKKMLNPDFYDSLDR